MALELAAEERRRLAAAGVTGALRTEEDDRCVVAGSWAERGQRGEILRLARLRAC